MTPKEVKSIFVQEMFILGDRYIFNNKEKVIPVEGENHFDYAGLEEQYSDYLYTMAEVVAESTYSINDYGFEAPYVVEDLALNSLKMFCIMHFIDFELTFNEKFMSEVWG